MYIPAFIAVPIRMVFIIGLVLFGVIYACYCAAEWVWQQAKE